MRLIELYDISKTYRLGEIDVPVLKGVSLTIWEGEFVAIMGASGSGKTTLMNILGCLDHPTSGRYFLGGADVAGFSSDEQALLRNRKIGFIFQNFNLLPRTSALENVMMPITYATRSFSSRELSERAEELLHKVGLRNRLHHEPSQLSGGEQQRVAIARALFQCPSLLLADEPTGNLDSKTSEEILDLFQRLNVEEGVTIVLVTHDDGVAGHSHRILRICDGVVQDHAGPGVLSPACSPSIRAKNPGKRRRLGSLFVQVRHILRTALFSLRRNILRAALTTLGIIIGVAAVIAMMEIGRGSSNAIRQTIASMGANNLLVYPSSVAFGATTAMTLTPQDGEAILRECSTICAVAPVVRARGQVVAGGRNWVPSTLYGTTPGFLDVRDWKPLNGEPFSEREVRNGSKVCMLGQTLVRELFPGQSPLGREVRINNVPFKVIGTLAIKGATMIGTDQDDILLAPWTTIKYRVTGSTQSSGGSSGTEGFPGVNTLSRLYPGTQTLYPVPSATQAADRAQPVRFTNVDHILTAVKSTGQMRAAVDQITRLLRDRHRIGPKEPDDFQIRDMTEISRTLSATATTMTNLLLMVALISLMVGGVGIMNIMLVSVTERTHEIGLRMAVGARRRAILRQFLVESVILCLLGGFAGILVGQLISYLVRVLLQWPTELSPDAILTAFSVSAAIGMGFGYYPAWKASRLDPIAALRFE